MLSQPTIETEAQLIDQMTTPSPEVEAAVRALDGDVVILGISGKMGPTLGELLVRAPLSIPEGPERSHAQRSTKEYRIFCHKDRVSSRTTALVGDSAAKPKVMGSSCVYRGILVDVKIGKTTFKGLRKKPAKFDCGSGQCPRKWAASAVAGERTRFADSRLRY